eukprot:COSAG06_NODE_9307_length_1932_cov_1.175123_4_plen_127_part_00
MEALPCELGANKGKDKDKDKEEGAQSHMTKLIWGLENVDSHLLDTDQRTNTSSMEGNISRGCPPAAVSSAQPPLPPVSLACRGGLGLGSAEPRRDTLATMTARYPAKSWPVAVASAQTFIHSDKSS